MAKYRLRPFDPLVFEARQWWPGESVEGLSSGSDKPESGDWIIYWPTGQKVVCKRCVFEATFEATYEPV